MGKHMNIEALDNLTDEAINELERIFGETWSRDIIRFIIAGAPVSVRADAIILGFAHRKIGNSDRAETGLWVEIFGDRKFIRLTELEAVWG